MRNAKEETRARMRGIGCRTFFYYYTLPCCLSLYPVLIVPGENVFRDRDGV